MTYGIYKCLQVGQFLPNK